MKETELAAPVVQWLSDQHWTVYQEVQFSYAGGVADIVAVRRGILWIIETKTSFSLEVLTQASRWMAHYRSVAVPKARGRDYRIAKDYFQVGVIEVSEFGVREEEKAPGFIRYHRDAKRMISQLTDLHKTYAAAGSQSGSHLTPYKQTMIEVRKVIEKEPGCTVKFLYGVLGEQHYSGKTSFMGNMVKCLMVYEGDWCRVDTSAKPYKLFIKDGAPPAFQYGMDHYYKSIKP